MNNNVKHDEIIISVIVAQIAIRRIFVNQKTRKTNLHDDFEKIMEAKKVSEALNHLVEQTIGKKEALKLKFEVMKKTKLIL